ncbi:MAG: hypothetical protein U0176_17090 [Bacteroidia bacterium]
MLAILYVTSPRDFSAAEGSLEVTDGSMPDHFIPIRERQMFHPHALRIGADS